MLFEVLFKPIELDKSERQQLKIPGDGKGIWNEIIEFLKHNEIKSIELFSRDSAVHFWTKLGFVEISEWIDHELFKEKNIRLKKMRYVV
ncbi:hypothetical protein J2T13_005047 [Paenibacillus sp. DS2015]